jgi:stage V sporulation protein SpoVS
MGTGQVSVNQAIKAIAIARGYLDENKIDLTVSPVFRNEEYVVHPDTPYTPHTPYMLTRLNANDECMYRRCAMSFMLHKSVLRSTKGSDEASTELRVAATSEPTVVAGSIAKKVRIGERVSVVSIGPGSVTQTIKAIVIARRYLEADRIDVYHTTSYHILQCLLLWSV